MTSDKSGSSNGDRLLRELSALETELIRELSALQALPDLEQFRVDQFGKKSRLTAISKEFGSLTPEERPKVGAAFSALRDKINGELETRIRSAVSATEAEELKKEKIDVTLPGRKPRGQFPHPVQMTQDTLVDIFKRCGFMPEVGPEVEHEFFNFDGLNFPANHPSRSMQDTFFIEGGDNHIVLRTHTSSVQVRTMLRQPPPIRMICPGRVYRAEYDATHSPMFSQIEGLLVDRDVNMGDLKGILGYMVEEFFGASLKVRLRPSFFPFTEPSAEVDMQCCFCLGKGCKTCKGSGWVEIGGCGMVDPEVFKACKIDSETFTGFAFGMGLERMAMLKFGVDDLRAFFESDHRFVSQFARYQS